jgi:GNAT superfamily N-acetyltransferase
MGLTSKPLSLATWPDFARLVVKHHGIFGGCWCISFHLEPGENKRFAGRYRELKESRIREGRAHAALVYDGPDVVGWCQFGPTAELPNIRSRKEYEKGLRDLPDWRITCFFIDRERRGEGIASRALAEALRYIGEAGGGTVEAYPEDYTGERTSSSFLCSGTLGMFTAAGFTRSRQIAMRRWVVVRAVAPSRTASVPSSAGVRPPRAARSSRRENPRPRAGRGARAATGVVAAASRARTSPR